jgi:VanZ family protein
MDRYKALIAVAMDSGAICFKSFYFFYFKYIKIIFLIFNINTSKSPKHTKDINLKTFNKFKNKKSTLQPYYQKMPTTKEKMKTLFSKTTHFGKRISKTIQVEKLFGK